MTAPRQDARAGALRAGRSQTARRAVLVGWAAKGIVYVALAWLVLQMALGRGQGEASAVGALQYIGNTGAGGAALVVLGIGLLAYAVGMVLEVTTLAGPTIDSKDRAAAVVLAVIYVSFAAAAFTIGDPLGSSPGGSGGAGGSEQQWSTFVFRLPGGQVIVGVLGLAIVGLGGYLAYKGVKQRFVSTLRTEQMSIGLRTFVRRAGTVAYVTKGAIYALLGYFLAQAAVTYNPQRTKGLDAALHEVAQAPWGRVLLGAVALGLVAYGLFCLIESRFRRVGASATGTT